MRLPDGLQALSFEGRREILIAPSGYAQRDEFRLAHELAELHVPKKLPDSDEHERFCDLAAVALMLPAGAVRADADEVHLDIERVHVLWPHASIEMTARRMTELYPAAASSWVDGRLRWRHAERGPSDSQAERVALSRAMRGSVADVTLGGVRARAWPLEARGAASRVVCLSLAADFALRAL